MVDSTEPRFPRLEATEVRDIGAEKRVKSKEMDSEIVQVQKCYSV